MSLIKCEKLTLSYDGVNVISDLSFSVEQGDYLCIMGENGSGKSTLIKGILGLKNASGGKIEFGDGLKQRDIGYLPQRTEVQRDFPASVLEVVMSGNLNSKGVLPFYSKQDKERADKAIRLLGISKITKKSYRELSGGQQQRVLLARALCASGKLIILDEPTAGLDVLASAEMYKSVSALNRERGITVITVSHDIENALADCTKVLHIGTDDCFFGTPSEYINTGYGKRFWGGNKV